MMHKMIRHALPFSSPPLAYFPLKGTATTLKRDKNAPLSERIDSMNPYLSLEEQLTRETQVQSTVTETNLLARCGWSAEEIVALLWLRQWYQTGGSDRVQIVRHLEFLKFLVLHGRLAV
jgi:hypothetical protein